LFNYGAFDRRSCPVSRQKFLPIIHSFSLIGSSLKNILFKIKELHKKNGKKISLSHLGIRIETTVDGGMNVSREWIVLYSKINPFKLTH